MTLAVGLVIEPLGKRHDRAAVSSGIPELDRYLARQAGQDVCRRIARVFVCRRGGADSVIGYYTLSALSIELMSLPDRLSRRLPRHPRAVRLDRSAGGRSILPWSRLGSAASRRRDQTNRHGE